MTSDGVTELLLAARRGDEQARSELWQVVYGRLRAMASARLRNERQGHSLSTTALVHEAYLQLDLVVDRLNTKDRNHFFALACKIMRQILIEHARHRSAAKRKGQHLPLEGSRIGVASRDIDSLLAIDQALSDLEQRDPRLGHVVECRFFGGLTTGETAEVMGVSTRTVERIWMRAKAYLHRALEQGGGQAPLSLQD